MNDDLRIPKIPVLSAETRRKMLATSAFRAMDDLDTDEKMIADARWAVKWLLRIAGLTALGVLLALGWGWVHGGVGA